MHKRENGFTMNAQNITSLDGSCYGAIHSSILQNVFSYLKIFSRQCIKTITIEDNKKRMNITNFINNIQIYIPILYVTKMTQNKNDNKLVLFQSEVIKYKSSRLIHVFLKILDVPLLSKEHHQNY